MKYRWDSKIKTTTKVKTYKLDEGTTHTRRKMRLPKPLFDIKIRVDEK
jgi:hypothetical protein